MNAPARDAEWLTAELVSVFGEDLRSAVVYGSAARGVGNAAGVNVLVLLRELDVPVLRRAAAPVREWVEAGNPPPLLLTEHELARSLDIFAIEYADIRDAHRVLHGADPFEGLNVDRRHIRLQCERELKGTLIQLREHLLLAGDDTAAAGRLLVASVSSLVALYRSVLRLSGGDVGGAAENVIREVSERTGARAEPVLEALGARRVESFAADPDGPLVAGYVEAVSRAVAYVDAMPVTE
jgi:hypothetical protein